MNINQAKSTSIFLNLQIVCAVVFVIFTFTYLYFYQSDVLMLTQHVFSGGKTRYQPLIGAMLITIVLFLLQLGIYFVTRLRLRFHALTYFPSVLLLAVLTNFEPSVIESRIYVHWFWIAPLLIIIWMLGVALVRQYQQIETYIPKVDFLVRVLWMNLLQLFVMFCFVELVGCSNDVLHYRLRMEAKILNKDYEAALNNENMMQIADSNMTMLRAFCLSQQHELGNRFFAYPVVGGSESLLPNNQNVKSLILPSDSIIRLSHRKSVYYDYKLVSYLLNRDLYSFVKELDKRYVRDEKLPVHYKEALMIYNRNNASDSLNYCGEAMKTSFQKFNDLRETKGRKAVVERQMKNEFGKTYWYYYFY